MKAFVFIKITKNNSEKNNCLLITETLQSYSKIWLKINSFTGMFWEVFWEVLLPYIWDYKHLWCKTFFYGWFGTTQTLTAKAIF